MSIESPQAITSAFGTPLALGHGSEVERSRRDVAVHRRRAALNAKAAGLAVPEGDNNLIDDRDADGRRPWERSAQANAENRSAAPIADRATDAAIGGSLDLMA
jgi:hypothetical protein